METIRFNDYQRIVIKVGSALISPDGHSCSTLYCLPLANFIKKCQHMGKQVTLVSSGAVAAGYNTLKPTYEHLTLKEKQALAAIGQSMVINHWQRFFDHNVAQILLTSADINHSERSINARNTIEQLHALDVLPIVNENDTVVTEELKFGDNDNLAAQVAYLLEADLLIICSDVDGLFDANPHQNPDARHIREIHQFNDDIRAFGQNSHNPQASGGMQTKLQAAEFAAKHGINSVICNGKNESYLALFNQHNPGTWIASNNINQTNNQKSITITNG